MGWGDKYSEQSKQPLGVQVCPRKTSGSPEPGVATSRFTFHTEPQRAATLTSQIEIAAAVYLIYELIWGELSSLKC